ncbi:hypothetical protein [Brevundimonas sp.]|uniref:hypothetical protein n=1 Tax=Brevundimonas sp. TaxID=1871086 RepID=UPI0025B9A2FB|nr:hypothetical protein [Brevundimonas sp.]
MPENPAYSRVGLSAGSDAPFPMREAFMNAVETCGVAVMELIARKTDKAWSSHVAPLAVVRWRSTTSCMIRFSCDDIDRSLRATSEAVGITDGKPKTCQAA